MKRNLKLKCLLLILPLIVPFSAACHANIGELFRPYQRVSKEPGRKDIVGIWVPDKDTLDDMQERGGYNVSVPTQIIIRDDGGFEMLNMPDWWNNTYGKSYKGFYDLSGHWDLSNISGYWEIGLKQSGNYRTINLVEHKTKDNPRYYIELIIGDADEGHEMIFVRK
jgi:hypothetical protein